MKDRKTINMIVFILLLTYTKSTYHKVMRDKTQQHSFQQNYPLFAECDHQVGFIKQEHTFAGTKLTSPLREMMFPLDRARVPKSSSTDITSADEQRWQRRQEWWECEMVIEGGGHEQRWAQTGSEP